MERSENTRKALKRIQNFTGLSQEECINVFESYAVFATYEYLENRPITIPFLGSFKVKYLHDQVKKKGKEAVVDVEFSPDPNFLRIVGQIADGREVNDAERTLLRRIKNDLEKILE